MSYFLDICINFVVGLFAVIFTLGLSYGIYKLFEWVLNTNPLILLIPIAVFVLYWLGRVLRDLAGDR